MLWWSFPFGSALSVAMAGVYYRFGGWRTRGMVARTVQAEAARDLQDA